MAFLTTPVRTQPPNDKRCISYAVAACIETCLCRQQGSATNVPELSVHDIFVQGGSQPGAIQKIIKAAPKGFVDAVCRPEGQARCATPSHLWTSRIEAVAFPGGQDRVAVMKNVLANAGPIVLFMQVFENFKTFTGAGPYRPHGTPIGFHAVSIIDVQEPAGGAAGMWVAKNSMGANWGDNGFFRVEWRDPDLEPESVVFVVKDVK